MSFHPLASLRTVTVATPLILPQIRLNPGEVFDVGLLVEAVTGAPTSGVLTAKWQVCPVEINGYNLNLEGDALARPWIDVTSAHAGLGARVLDALDWPATIADYTYARTSSGGSTAYPAAPAAVSRRIRGGGMHSLVRCVLTTTLAGGTSPAFVVTATGETHYP